MAEFERDNISERTREGLAAARARGRKGGRRPVLTETKLAAAREMYGLEALHPPVDRRHRRLLTYYALPRAEPNEWSRRVSRHRSQDEAPTDAPAMLRPGDLVSVHLVGPAGGEGFFTGEVKALGDATGSPVVVIEGADAPDVGELTRLAESNDQLQADLREARAEIERCHERVRELVIARDDELGREAPQPGAIHLHPATPGADEASATPAPGS